MSLRILSLGTAVPSHSATQEEVLDCLGFTKPSSKAIFRHTGIERRYSYIDPKRFRDEPRWQELMTEYHGGVVELGAAAARDALGEIPTRAVGLLSFSSVTGYLCPAPSYALAAELGLNDDISHTNILGQGCQAAVPSVQRAYEWLVTRGHGIAVSITVELCSCTYFPQHDERDVEYIVAASLFGDGATAAVLGYGDDPRYPAVVDFESYFSKDHIDLLGYTWVDGRLKVRLDRRVPEVVPPAMRHVTDKLLARHGLRRADIAHWMIHPGGKTVLEGIERELGLSREQTWASWDVMRTHGNMSSATLGFIAKEVQTRGPQGWGVALTQGAGTAVNAMLLRWG